MTLPAEPPAPHGQDEGGVVSALGSSSAAKAEAEDKADAEAEDKADAGAAGRVPDFFLVGHPKCGTTALYEMLRRHPQIYMPERKEPRFFASDLPSPYQPRPSGAPAETYADYLALFAAARPEQLVGEGSTAYIWSATAAGLIAAAQPAARIIVVLREPASFLRSLHLQLLQHRSEQEPSLRKAIALEEQRRQGRQLTQVNEHWPQVLMYTDRVRYVEQLRRYHAVFPHDQVLVLIYDDLRGDNAGTLRTVQRFLGVEDRPAAEAVEVNPTVRRRVRIDEALRRVLTDQGSAARAARATVRLLTPSQLRSAALRQLRRRVLFAGPRPPEESLMLELRRRFKPEVEALSEYLGRDLVALWGYDKLD
jgi:sulfotransferase family protein